MKCIECGEETDGIVCRGCGLVVESRPIARDIKSNNTRKWDLATLYSAGQRVWQHPLSPNIRPMSRAFKPRYQKKYVDYVYIKAYESISKSCAHLQLPEKIKFEALNLFKGIRELDSDFFKNYKLSPTYLACIKIACRINDFPISNYELANIIDYETDLSRKNLSYMERRFNRAYRAILKLYNLTIKTPEHPAFIDYVCNKLNIPYSFVIEIHNRYTMLKRFFQPHFRVEGYILALIYIYGNQQFGLYLKTLEEMFHTSAKTIGNRKNEILYILKKIRGKDDSKEM